MRRLLERARPIPRISIQAFCDDPRAAEVLQYAAEDRRLSKAHVSVHMGGIAAAIAHYVDSPTPNLIIVDSALKGASTAARTRQSRAELRSGHQGYRHRPLQRRHAVPRTSEARRQRISGRAHRPDGPDGKHLQPLQQSRHRSGRSRLRVHRREGRRRLVNHLPQRRLDAVGSS